MKKTGRIIWLPLVALVAALPILLWKGPRLRAPGLPPAADYASRSPRFNARLTAARHAALTPPTDPAAVRVLAHVYQANQLDAEARACYAWLANSGGGLGALDHRLLADLALRAGDLPGGVTELKAVLASDPGYLPARVILAECFFKSGQEPAAEEEYGQILAREPDQRQALLGLARLALQRRDDAMALARLERLLAVHPDATSGIALLAQILTRRGETERAGALRELSRQKPDPLPADPWLDALWTDCFDAQRLTLRFEELVNTGQWDEARPLLDRVAELDPGSWLPHFFRGWTLNRQHRPADAVGEYQLALQKSGDPERILPMLVPVLQELDRAAEAEAEVNRALRTRPDSVGLLTLQSELVTRRQGDARPLLVALLQRDPYLYRPNMDLAQILEKNHERAAALVCLVRVAKAYPLDVASRGLLGEYYLEDNAPDRAIPPLEQALPLATEPAAQQRLSALLATAWLKLGASKREAGSMAEAADYFEKAAHFSPAGLEALGALVGEAMQAKQFRAAATLLQRLATLQPGNPTIQISLGDALYQAGEMENARASWTRALELAAPGDTALRSALATRLSGHITPDLFE